MLGAVVVAAFLVLPASAAATAGWSIEPTPEPVSTVDAGFSDVSCVSSSFCMAVGFFSTSSREGPMYSLWNGSVWSRGQAVGSAGVRSIELRKVSCVSSTRCMAVGYLVDESGAELPVAEQWNGSAWTRNSVPVPGPESDNPQLTAVDCVAADSCFAAGGSGSDSPFVAHWDGSSWTSQAFAGPLSGRFLMGISCSSATACVAVGSRNTSTGGFAPLVAMFDGSAWTVDDLPEPAGATSSQLFGISCARVDYCVAVGGGQSASVERPFTTIWDGTRWREQVSPPPMERRTRIWPVFPAHRTAPAPRSAHTASPRPPMAPGPSAGTAHRGHSSHRRHRAPPARSAASPVPPIAPARQSDRHRMGRVMR